MVDTEATVRMKVPSYQREEWRAHADELGMSQSEFVRSMVQAGRHGFDLDTETGEPRSDDATPGVDDLETRVLDVLDEESRSWDEIVGALTKDLEDRLETTLQRLQREGRVQYNGRRGGYAVTGTDVD
ncbi:DUF5805 domain-containing protein [Halococcus hamelinensis]|uniref:Uncharacterized protein n=1 Tax=Halococcus hamelinensis 100A6 TaxID=1132509 RepID=M0M039_9EURY|nr:DUF5805 domain-containing protein [Halococcus hamelinensis]EMA37979.1 hypothetical protein C447_11100 [Halococcus hamelinensis 100A6]